MVLVHLGISRMRRLAGVQNTERRESQIPYFKPFPAADESALKRFGDRAQIVVRRCTRTLHMQCVPGGPRVDAPSYALEHATMGAERGTTNTFGCSHGTPPTYRIAVASIHGCYNQDTVHLHDLHTRSARRMPLLCSMATRDG